MVGTAAILGTAAAQIGSSIFGGLLGKSAADKAAEQQAKAAQQVVDNTKGTVAGGQADVAQATGQANDVLGQSLDRQTNLYNPYVKAGTDSLSNIQDISGPNGDLTKQFSFNPSDLSGDAGYQFTLNEGQKAIQRAAAAKGGLFSGSTLKSLAGYTTGAANTFVGDAFNRAKSIFDENRQGSLDRLNAFQNLAGLGLSATGGSSGAIGSVAAQQSSNLTGSGNTRANLGMQGAGIIGNALTAKGNSEAAGTVGGANSITSAISNGSKAIGDFLVLRGLNQGSAPTSGGGPAVSIPQVLGTASNAPIQYWPGTTIPRT